MLRAEQTETQLCLTLSVCWNIASRRYSSFLLYKVLESVEVFLLWHSVFATYLGCLSLKELKHFILKDLIIISVCMCASVEVKDNFVDLSFHTYVDSED